MANEKKQPEQLPEGITAEMIAEAKAKYGENKVRIAELPLDDDGNDYLPVLIRVPDRKVMGEFEKWMDKQPNKAKELLVNSCLLTHKDRVKAEDELFFTCVNAIADLIPIRKANIKNC